METVDGNMRPRFRQLILLAGVAGLAATGMAQWQHFGDNKPGVTATVGSKPSSLGRDMVAAHNAVRARVGTAPLRWSEHLASVAQEWADSLMASGQLQHSHNPNYGENLYEITGAPATSALVIDAWAREVGDYTYSSNSCRNVCGHYTQVVWNDTKEVGCAVARGGGREVWVCEYNPPGNWIGRKPW